MKKITFRLFLGILFVFSGQLIAQNAVQSIDNQMEQLLENTLLTPQDAQWAITDQNVSRVSNISHVYYRQVFNGLQIYGTESGVHVLPSPICQQSFYKKCSEQIEWFKCTCANGNTSGAVGCGSTELYYYRRSICN